MQHFLKIGGKRYGEVRNFKKVRKFASSNLKCRSSKFKFTEILICNPGKPNEKTPKSWLLHEGFLPQLTGSEAGKKRKAEAVEEEEEEVPVKKKKKKVKEEKEE